MNPPPETHSTPRKLSTAEERREAVVAAAVPIFAELGFRAASTSSIAEAAGISQAYLFRLFPTKTDLFVAAYGAAHDRILAIMTRAAAGAEERDVVLESMGRAYGEMLANERDLLLLQLQAQVFAGEPRVSDAVRGTFEDLYDLAAERSGADEEELRGWFAKGMLMNVMAAIGAPELDAEWAETLCMKFDEDR